MKAVKLTAAVMAIALLGVGASIALASGGSSSHRAKYAHRTATAVALTPTYRMAKTVKYQTVKYPRTLAGVGQTLECQLPPSERPSPSQVRHMTPEQLAARCHVMVEVKHFTFGIQSRRPVGPHSGQHMLCTVRVQRVLTGRLARSLRMTPEQLAHRLCGTKGPVKTGTF
jgi:hypothetical protein